MRVGSRYLDQGMDLYGSSGTATRRFDMGDRSVHPGSLLKMLHASAADPGR